MIIKDLEELLMAALNQLYLVADAIDFIIVNLGKQIVLTHLVIWFIVSIVMLY